MRVNVWLAVYAALGWLVLLAAVVAAALFPQSEWALARLAAAAEIGLVVMFAWRRPWQSR